MALVYSPPITISRVLRGLPVLCWPRSVKLQARARNLPQQVPSGLPDDSMYDAFARVFFFPGILKENGVTGVAARNASSSRFWLGFSKSCPFPQSVPESDVRPADPCDIFEACRVGMSTSRTKTRESQRERAPSGNQTGLVSSGDRTSADARIGTGRPWLRYRNFTIRLGWILGFAPQLGIRSTVEKCVVGPEWSGC